MSKIIINNNNTSHLYCAIYLVQNYSEAHWLERKKMRGTTNYIDYIQLYALAKRTVFKLDLNESNVSIARIKGGNLFHKVGAEEVKARSPKEDLVL